MINDKKLLFDHKVGEPYFPRVLLLAFPVAAWRRIFPGLRIHMRRFLA